MFSALHALAQQLIGKPLGECSVEEVKGLTHRYPYFAPARFLLLHKLRQEGLHEEADVQYQEAVLFYPDPLQFEAYVSSESFFGGEEPEGPALNATASAPVFNYPLPSVDGQKEVSGGTQEEEHTDESFGDDKSPATKESGFEPFSPRALQEDQHLALAATGLTEEEKPAAPPSTTCPAEETEQNPFPASAETTKTSPAENTPLLVDETNGADTGKEMAFEPYHTVDYFASQGIKINVDEAPKDKLGKSLKSFTEWLKTMKRLPAAEAALPIAAERSIETMAGASVSQSDVVTEAMAEVWAKQGNHEKALDIYNKLSLHNPSRTAYFAAKIQNLKSS